MTKFIFILDKYGIDVFEEMRTTLYKCFRRLLCSERSIMFISIFHFIILLFLMYNTTLYYINIVDKHYFAILEEHNFIFIYIIILVVAHAMHRMGYFEGNVSVTNVLDSHELHDQLNVCYV